MSKVCICSIFRDSISRNNNELQRYFERLEGLDYKKEDLFFSFVEGDSKDNTLQALQAWSMSFNEQNCIIDKLDSNLPHYGSVVNAERFKILTEVANRTLDNAIDKWDDIEWFLWLESDLIFEPNLINKLIESADNLNTKFIAPMIFNWSSKEWFYDTYAFIEYETKEQFFNGYPYHPSFKNQPLKMHSVGSTMLIHSDIIKAGARWHDERAIIDLCNDARNAGFDIWTDPSIIVYHPT